jgi:serine/threonine protein kinase
MPPEALEFKYTPKSDIYSFGIMMWVLLTGKLQVYDPNIKDLLVEVVINGLRPVVPSDNKDLAYKNLMQKCWSRNPKDRPTARDLLSYVNSL